MTKRIATRPHTIAGVTRQVPVHTLPHRPLRGDMVAWSERKRADNPEWRAA